MLAGIEAGEILLLKRGTVLLMIETTRSKLV